MNIAATAFPYYKGYEGTPFEYLSPNKDPNEMCPYCKNTDTDRIRGIDLNKYVDFYKETAFKVFKCYCCNAEFSYYTPPTL